ncbi:hypothetical protein PFISCL1PPCAC_631, partial [Pristionchus fissidentatus]
ITVTLAGFLTTELFVLILYRSFETRAKGQCLVVFGLIGSGFISMFIGPALGEWSPLSVISAMVSISQASKQ